MYRHHQTVSARPARATRLLGLRASCHHSTGRKQLPVACVLCYQDYDCAFRPFMYILTFPWSVSNPSTNTHHVSLIRAKWPAFWYPTGSCVRSSNRELYYCCNRGREFIVLSNRDGFNRFAHTSIQAWLWDWLCGLFDEVHLVLGSRMTFPSFAYLMARYVSDLI